MTIDSTTKIFAKIYEIIYVHNYYINVSNIQASLFLINLNTITMKSLVNFINESNNYANLGDLNYVMNFKGFKTWIEKQDKKAKFTIVGIVDDIDLQDLDPEAFSDTYFNEEDKQWVGDISGDAIPVKEWTLADDDIILIWA